jgi:3-oxoacyl-[acyl-carrier-protein] synthase II
MNPARVVVTGMGAVTPLGVGAAPSFARLLRGESGIGPVPETLRVPGTVPDLEVRIAGCVPDLEPHLAQVFDVKTIRRTARVVHVAAVAAEEAVRQAGLGDAYRPERRGVVMGVAFGGMEACFDAARSFLERGPQRVSPFAVTMIMPSMVPSVVARLAGAAGPSFSVASACASGAHAIGEGVRLLRAGAVDVAVCGGADACVTPLTMAAFSRMMALSTRPCAPREASSPFDRGRDGFVLAEGAAVLVLERADRAMARGATILGEVAGFGASTEHHDATAPDPSGEGMVLAIQSALDDACVDAAQVAHVNAHGTSTPLNDAIETIALKRVFGDHAKKLWISATKGATGHALGAAGAIEAVFTLQALAAGCAPPTLNLRDPDPACDLDYVPLEARQGRLDVAVSPSFAFGGQNAALVLRRVS